MTPSHDINIAQLMIDQLESRETHPAFVLLDEAGRTDQVITFERLHDLVSAVAGGLRERGVSRGSRVVVFVPMSIELYITMLAVMRLGAVVAFIDPWCGRSTIEHAAKLIDADAFIGTPRSFVMRTMSPSLRRIDIAMSTGGRWIPGASRFVDLLQTPRAQHVTRAAPTTADTPALITFTGAGGGLPMGANRTHGILAAQHRSLSHHMPVDDGARVWTNLPIIPIHNLGNGATTVLPPAKLAQDSSPDPKALHQLVARSGATTLALSPTPLMQLSRAPGRAPLTTVERVYTGGGPITPELLDAAAAVLPNAHIDVVYGSAEADPISSTSAADVIARRAAMREHGGIYVGREVDDIDVMIVRAERGPIVLEPGTALEDWTVAPGAAGEVIVAGEHVSREYWKNPDAARLHKAIDETGRVWHRTGDVARRDDDGGLWLLGQLNSGWTMRGRQYWTLEVETPVTDLPEVVRAAVCMPKFTGSDREFKNASAVLAVEPADGFERAEARDAAVRSLDEKGLSAMIEVRSIKKIPVDKRHASHVDIAALQDKLKPENQDDY